MTAPKRVQMSRQHPWRADNPDAVIVARPSRWGNPYGLSPFLDKATARALAVSAFRAWITQDTLDPDEWTSAEIVRHVYFRAALESGELAGRDLACWCPLDAPCHADVLLSIANGGDGS